MSDSLWLHELHHARPPCPSPTPGVHSDSRPWSQWCHPAISSSVIPFSSCPQSLPASESFPMSQLFAWGGQSTGVSAVASFPPKKSQGWSPSEWTGWISLQSKGLLRVFSNTTVQKHQFFSTLGSSVHSILQERTLEWTAIPSPLHLPDPGIKPTSPALQADSSPSQPQGSPGRCLYLTINMFALGQLFLWIMFLIPIVIFWFVTITHCRI